MRSTGGCALLRKRSLGCARCPGVERVTAWGLLAEIGFNIDQFPTAAHLASGRGYTQAVLKVRESV